MPQSTSSAVLKNKENRASRATDREENSMSRRERQPRPRATLAAKSMSP